MKEWIKNINDAELARLYKDTTSLADVPALLRERVLARVKAEAEKNAIARRGAGRRAPLLKPLIITSAAALAAAIAFIVLLPFIGPGSGLASAVDSDLALGFVGISPSQALVGFVAGEVKALSGQAWLPVGAGTLLARGQTLKTGPSSSCSLQFGDGAVSIVGENAEISLSVLSLGKNAAVTVGVEAGRILSRVAALSGDRQFQIITDPAVCGVYGTEFWVEVNQGSGMRIAVREGSVYVLPVRMDPAVLAAGSGALPRLAALLKNAAPKVEAGEKIEIDFPQRDALESPYAPLIEYLNSIAQAGGGEDAGAMERLVTSSTSAAAATLPWREPLSAADAKAFSGLTGIPLLPVRIRENNAADETAKETAGPALVRVEINVLPPDSLIFLNGHERGRGRFQGVFAAGTSLEFTAKREGYGEATRTIEAAWGTLNVYTMQLKETGREATKRTEESGATVMPSSDGKAAVTAVLKLSEAGLTGDLATFGELASAGGTVFGADKNGVIYAVAGSGTLVWKLATANSPNTNSSPILIDGRVYFSGSRELVIADAVTGRLLGRVALEASANHMFGRHVVRAGADLILPTDTSLRIIDPISGAMLKEYRLPETSRMTPAEYNGKIYLVDSTGAVRIIDAKSGQADPQPILTDAVEPVAMSLALYGGRGYFTGRKNLLACVDVLSKKVLWQKQLTCSGYASSDLLAGENGVVVLVGQTLAGFSPYGQPLWTITGISAPPLLSGGFLYAGTTDGRLLALDLVRGTAVQILELKKVVSARPVASGSLIAFGTAAGEIVFIQ